MQLANAAVSASPDGTKEPIVDLCETLQTQKKTILHTRKWRLIWDLLRLKFAPQSFAKPQLEIVPTAPELRLPLPPGPNGPGRPAVGRNLILSFEPPASVQSSAAGQEAQKRFAEVNLQLRSMRAELTGLVTAPDAQACVDRAKSSAFDFKRFDALAGEYADLEWVNRIREGRIARGLVANELRHLHMKWEFFTASDLGMVLRALRNPEIRNVMIIGHATSDGEVIDGSAGEIPERFLSDASPSLESISIFSCHGTAVRAHYDLTTRLARFPTYHWRREIFTPQSTELAGERDVVPINSVVGFLRRVDRWLARSPFDYKAPTQPRIKPECAIELTGVDVQRGEYAFLLNNEIIGAISAWRNPRDRQTGVSGRALLRFGCDRLDRPKNVLVTRNISFDERSELAQPEAIQATWINDQGVRITLPQAAVYRRPNGDYQSSKWELTR